MAEPEIFEFTITKADKMIVIASDGVWEFLSNEEVSINLISLIRSQQLSFPSLKNEMQREQQKPWSENPSRNGGVKRM